VGSYTNGNRLVTIPQLGGQYDPNLAIVTMTVIAVIWYTYFTYRSVHREPTAYLLLDLTYERSFDGLRPAVTNPSERTLEVRLTLDIWVDQKKVTMDAFYSGQESKKVGPTQGFKGVVDLNPYTSAREILVRMTARWTDDLGDSGSTLPIYKRIEPMRASYDLVAPSEIDRHFKGLPGF